MNTPRWFLRKNGIAYALIPLSWIYYLISKVVFLFRGLHPHKSQRPVICVGNIFAGGVGKTPIVRAIAEHYNAPVVMRGYKRKTRNVLGDEGQMLKNFGLDVYVGDRKNNTEYLNQESEIINHKSPIIMDDGFQNPTIKKDFSIIVFDGKIGFGNGFLLPAGPLREPLSAISRADAILIIQDARRKTQDTLYSKLIKYNKPVFYASVIARGPKIKTKNIIAFSGIGYPEKFFATVRREYGANNVRTVSFPDHYNFTNRDIKKLFTTAEKLNATLITTEKDFVRIPFGKNKIRVLPIAIELDDDLFKLIDKKIKK